MTARSASHPAPRLAPTDRSSAPTLVPAAAPAADFAGDDARWRAVERREPAADGRFVYAVRTTGVFCRPTCPSRRPLRANVRFFDAPAQAARAGFRPCQRCRPTEPARESAVERARAYLHAHPDEPITLPDLARIAGQSPSHLQRAFTRAYGLSPKRYAAALRAERMKHALRAGATVSRASFDAGYGASSRVYEAASTQLGMSPAAYRRGGHGVRMRYLTTDSPLGRLLVAATAQGVSAVTLGDDDAQLVEALAAEYPRAERAEVSRHALDADDPLRLWTDAIVRALEGRTGTADVPTDVAGTPFQQRVWDALRAIPAGETRSYTEVAAAIGAPRAVRAVAGACASNHLAFVIPCHRVVREDGSLGGYRWGLERKRQLLAREHGVVVRRLAPRAPRRSA